MELWQAPITDSAYRHEIADEDIRHALRDVLGVADDPEDEDVTLSLGPDRVVNLIEVGVLDTNDGPLIIHAMPARTRRFPPRKE